MPALKLPTGGLVPWSDVRWFDVRWPCWRICTNLPFSSVRNRPLCLDAKHFVCYADIPVCAFSVLPLSQPAVFLLLSSGALIFL